MGLTQQVPSLGHDGLYAAQLPDVPKSLADLYYRDAQGAYGAGVLARNTAYRAVDLFGSSAWNLPERQPNFDKYRHLVRVQWVPITL